MDVWALSLRRASSRGLRCRHRTYSACPFTPRSSLRMASYRLRAVRCGSMRMTAATSWGCPRMSGLSSTGSVKLCSPLWISTSMTTRRRKPTVIQCQHGGGGQVGAPPPGIEWQHHLDGHYGLEVLGVSLGSEGYISRFLAAKAAELVTRIDSIVTDLLNSASRHHAAWPVLLDTLQHKLAYWCRNCFPRMMLQSCPHESMPSWRGLPRGFTAYRLHRLTTCSCRTTPLLLEATHPSSSVLRTNRITSCTMKRMMYLCWDADIQISSIDTVKKYMGLSSGKGAGPQHICIISAAFYCYGA